VASEALAVVQEIAVALEAPVELPATEHYTLAGGMSGVALFFFYLARASGERRYAEVARRLIRESVAALTKVAMKPWLYEGFSGIVWAASHLSALDPESEAVDFTEIDRVMRDYLGRTPWRAPYDLIGGLVGYGVYALDRLPGTLAWECLRRVVERLEETAERDGKGARWHTAPELLPAHQLERWPRGHYNLGLAHGVPGPIALLGAVCLTPLEERARPLLKDAVRWLLAQRLGPDAGGGFPAWVCAEEQPEGSRLAWCYGDAGVAAALMTAAVAAHEPDWKLEARELARRAAPRPADEAGAVDPGLCHGYAGLGHVFNRLWQYTRDEELERAARFWIELTLDRRQPGTGIAGFHAMLPDATGTLAPQPDSGFLTGTAGVGLALLAASCDPEPAWDRALLLSAPGPPARPGRDRQRGGAPPRGRAQAREGSG
jgi:hypothetical protein